MASRPETDYSCRIMFVLRLSEAYFKPVLEAQACQVHSLLEE
jgi:hypothetical protein